MSFLAFAGTFALSTILGIDPVRNAINQAVYPYLPNNLADVATLTDLRIRDKINSTEYDEIMKKLGYDTATQTKFLQGAEVLLTALEEVERLRSRSFTYITDNAQADLDESPHPANLAQFKTDFDNSLIKLGFTPTTRDDFFIATKPKPSFQEVIEMLAKEVFEPDQRSFFQLDDDKPALFTKLASQYGLTDAESGNYWAMHWSHLSPQQFIEIYQRFGTHRTVDQPDTRNLPLLQSVGLTMPDVEFTNSQFDDYTKLIELAPKWRDSLKAISFRTFPQIFLRWGYEEGEFTQEEIVGKYQDLGYSYPDAVKIGSIFAKRFTRGRKNSLTNNTLQLFEIGAKTEADALEELEMDGFETATAQEVLDRISDKVKERKLQLKLDRIEQQYIRGELDDTELATEVGIVVTENEAREAEEIEIIKLNKGKKQPKLPLAQLIKAFNTGIINETQFRAKLTVYNYSIEDQDILVSTNAPAV